MLMPDFLTRYYPKGEYPFVSLNDLPLEEANRIKKKFCKKNGIGFFYAKDDYLIHWREIEKRIYSQLIEKGGHPRCSVPVYMVLGESPRGKYDIRADIQKDASEIQIPIKDLDMKSVSFTYPDSMYELEYDELRNLIGGKRTNTPKVYTFEDIPELIRRYNVYGEYLHYIEAQVWDRELLRQIWERSDKYV